MQKASDGYDTVAVWKRRHMVLEFLKIGMPGIPAFWETRTERALILAIIRPNQVSKLNPAI